ncbi:carboxypeptidase C [Savitreella phatthalungensis]
MLIKSLVFVSAALAAATQQTFHKSTKSPKIKVEHSDFSIASDESFPAYALRHKSPGDLGLDKVKQQVGYLDTDKDKHFFYWFFESRNDPKKDPVVLWLNGGPGCSSLTGLFFELGPSSVNEDGETLTYNPHAWNQNASVIFLDQPMNVGYSYGSGVSDTVAAGKDVYAFLSLFFKTFPEYSDLDFHIAGESYAGHYIPQFAKEVVEHQSGKSTEFFVNAAPKQKINLKTVLIGNGLIDPLVQYPQYRPMACGEGGYEAVLSPSECSSMESAESRCSALIQSCYSSGSRWSCVPAALYCNSQLIGPYQRTGRNVYDIRGDCEGGNLCYPQLDWIQKYLNRPEVMKAVGAEVDQYASCNMDINKNFLFAGDWMRPYYTGVQTILEAGIQVLVYAGDTDFICNWLGSKAFIESVEYADHEGMTADKPLKKWKMSQSIGNLKKGTTVGETKNSGNLTFLRVYEAGHMVPYDQPESALEMLNRWISGHVAFA